MKLKIVLITFLIGSLFYNCTVSESFILKKNKEVEYSALVDMTPMFSTLDMSDNSFSMRDGMKITPPAKMDTTIKIVDILKHEQNLTDDVLAQMKDDIKNIEPFYYRMKSDLDNGVLNVELGGNFKNADAFNKAIASLIRVQGVGGDGAENEMGKMAKKGLESILNVGELSWNGKVMEYELLEKPVEVADEDNDNDEEERAATDFISMFANPLAGGNMEITTSFHFPRKVKNVSESNAGIYNDGKTVKIENIRAMDGEKIKISVK